MDNTNEIKKNFGQRAYEYRLSSTHGNPEDLNRMVGLIDPNLDDNVLDVATGAGHTAIALAKFVNKVVAIDITPEMLAEAKTASIQNDISNITFRTEDVHNLNISDCQFDIVASRFAVHHFSDVRSALREMCRVLKRGGKFYILDCSVVDGDESEREINRIELLRDSSHQYSYSPRFWKRLLQDLPVTIAYASLIQSQYKLPVWFDRMGTNQSNREEIFKILNNLSSECKINYPFGNDYITTYRYEILARKD